VAWHLVTCIILWHRLRRCSSCAGNYYWSRGQNGTFLPHQTSNLMD